MKGALFLGVVLVLSAPAASGGRSPAVPAGIGFWDSTHGIATFWRCSRCPVQVATTQDGGRTWKTIRRGPPNTGVLAAPPAAAWVGRLVTFDRGQTWTTLPRRMYRPFAFADAHVGWGLDHLEAADAEPQRLAKSTSGGRRWARVRNPCHGLDQAFVGLSAPTRRAAWVLCGGISGAGNESKSVLRTVDGGRHWRLVNSVDFRGAGHPIVGHGLSTAGYAGGIAMGADGAGWLWERRGWAYRTFDGGRNWHAWKLAAPEEREVESVSIVSRRTTFVLRIDRIRDGQGRAFRLLKTIDAGRTWRLVRKWVFDW